MFSNSIQCNSEYLFIRKVFFALLVGGKILLILEKKILIYFAGLYYLKHSKFVLRYKNLIPVQGKK